MPPPPTRFPSISGADAPNKTQLVFLHTNDTHGHPLKFADSSMDDVGGLPARAELVSQVRGKYQNVLLLDAGDLNTGRPESNFFEAEPDILGYNYLGYDAMAIGNHEFDNPLNTLQKQMAMAEFRFCPQMSRIPRGNILAGLISLKSSTDLRLPYSG